MTGVRRETAYIVSPARRAEIGIVLGQDAFIVRHGKIAVQTYTLEDEPH